MALPSDQPIEPSGPSINAVILTRLLIVRTSTDHRTVLRADLLAAWLNQHPNDQAPLRHPLRRCSGTIAQYRLFLAVRDLEKRRLIRRDQHPMLYQPAITVLDHLGLRILLA